MSKVQSFKIFVNGVGYNATGYGITPNFFSLEQPDGQTIFFPWVSIKNVRLVKEWAEMAAKHEQQAREEAAKAAAAEQQRQNPKIEIPGSPGNRILPFVPKKPS